MFPYIFFYIVICNIWKIQHT